MPQNADLHTARRKKKDEFYTQLDDITKEMQHYTKHFEGKTVYCNCDDPRASNFFHYFSHRFIPLGLKKLIASCYKNQSRDFFSTHDVEKAVYLEYAGDKNKNRKPDVEEIAVKKFKENGDFRSLESIALLKQTDIVVTNPPFSLFREYVNQLIKYKKRFIILGNLNALTYKEIFPLVKENKLWFGVSISSGDREFGVPDDYPISAAGYRIDERGNKFIRVKGVRWFTNLEHDKRHEDLNLYKRYYGNEKNYPTYDNYDAINVDKTNEIPMDYEGAMGVPITFLDKYNPAQFEIIGLANDKREINDAFIQGQEVYLDEQHKKFVGMVLKENNKLRATYARIIIKNRRI